MPGVLKEQMWRERAGGMRGIRVGMGSEDRAMQGPAGPGEQDVG